MIHVSFPSIEQFRHVVKVVKQRAKFHEVEVPTLKFNGTVKLHGTNAGVVFDPFNQEMWAQSREQIITPEKDNAGFAKFVEDKSSQFHTYFNIIAGIYGNNKIQPGNLIAVYGEWCGQGIQKGVAINQLPRMFVIFAVRVKLNDEESVWFYPEQLLEAADIFGSELANDHRIFSIQKFKTWNIEINFKEPEQVQNQLIEVTNEVESLCPVGKIFDVDGIGEGVVWRCVSEWNIPGVPDELDVKIKTSDLQFKVKGEKHSDTKVKTLVTVDVERLNSIHEFAKNVTTDHRLEKMLEKLKELNYEIDPKNTREFIKLVGQDVLKEEYDTIKASGFDHKEIMPVINKISVKWFLDISNNIGS